MREVLLGAGALAAIVAIPFLLRPKENVVVGGDPVVVLTPHNEAIRFEFARGFQHYMQRRGRAVHVDWRTPGGTAEITRFVVSEYAASFERHYRGLGRHWTSTAATSFANARIALPDDPATDGEAERARRAFLASNVGIGIDVLFGGGSFEFSDHADSGRLVDAGVIARHPDWFGSNGIPSVHGGEPYWDPKGRWIGACLTGFGICYSADAVARLGIQRPPQSWEDLASPRYFGRIALADPGKSGSANKAFEMIVQSQMNAIEPQGDRAPREGWSRGLRLIRRIAANARYFTDSASRIPLDVATGDAAAGMCIDFYGRFQSETAGAASRLAFVSPKNGTSIGTDPIGLLRGAPSPDLARELIDYVLSMDGQKLWDFRVGTPGGPEKYALRRLPIQPALYDPAFASLLADPDADPYRQQGLDYHEEWTSPIFRAIAFVVRSMCVDPFDELVDAWRALRDARFPPAAEALFDDVSAIDYETTRGPIRAALRSGEPADEMALSTRLTNHFRNQYRRAAALAREGR